MPRIKGETQKVWRSRCSIAKTESEEDIEAIAREVEEESCESGARPDVQSNDT